MSGRSALLILLLPLLLGACARAQQGSSLVLRLSDDLPLVATPRFAVVDTLRVSTVPLPLPPPERAQLLADLIASAEAQGWIHDPDQPELLLLAYRESSEPRRPELHPVRVDWTYGERSGTYRYPIPEQDYPPYRVGILVLDLIDPASGELRRQAVDPDFFLMQKLLAKDEAVSVPRAYGFPLAVLAARSSGAYSRERTPDQD